MTIKANKTARERQIERTLHALDVSPEDTEPEIVTARAEQLKQAAESFWLCGYCRARNTGPDAACVQCGRHPSRSGDLPGS